MIIHPRLAAVALAAIATLSPTVLGDDSHGLRLGNTLQNERKMAGAVCVDPGVTYNAQTEAILTSLPKGQLVIDALRVYQKYGYSIGSTKEMLIEASDATATNATIADGKSGDTNFPFGKFKVLATMGEQNVCEGPYKGQKLNGVPDGVGAYLEDDATVRMVYQSESYGPILYETSPYKINKGAAMMGGSHVHYVDYDRELMSNFMANTNAASSMVTGAGNMIETAYNLKGELIGRRNRTGANAVGAHYGNCDASGKYVVARTPTLDYDWFYQSFCSASMENIHQWGPGIGLQDKLFMTNEEWMFYQATGTMVGLGAHALDVARKTMWAVGAFGQGGFEKIVEINSQHPDYVIWAPSGYNGDFSPNEARTQPIADRNAGFGMRKDGKPYIWPQNILPMRIYIGIKGKMEDGSAAPSTDFLARNGLRFGKLYGYAIDMNASTGPTKGLNRDDFHRNATMAKNGAEVAGKWMPSDWQWDGKVKNFHHDAAWEYQNPPPNATANFLYWTSAGPDKAGCKCEHVSPDTTAGVTGFVSGSTCGYVGHYMVNGVLAALNAAKGGLPQSLDGMYYVYQGELDVTSQIKLGGKGQYPNGLNATRMYRNAATPTVGKNTFDNIDGLEVISASDGMYLIIQEDGGNIYGERMFAAKLERNQDGKELDYYLLALGRGRLNTRAVAGVGIPHGTNCGADANEFSGVHDLSGLLLKNSTGMFRCRAADTGRCFRDANRMVPMNKKQISINLQAGDIKCGIMEAFVADRGGQIYMLQPNLPV